MSADPAAAIRAWMQERVERHARLRGRPLPSLAAQARSAGQAAVRFAGGGFRQAPPEVVAARQEICQACEWWDGAAFASRGRCRKCGCSGLKLRLPAEKCPLGKWSAVPMPA